LNDLRRWFGKHQERSALEVEIKAVWAKQSGQSNNHTANFNSAPVVLSLGGQHGFGALLLLHRLVAHAPHLHAESETRVQR